ncbi:hypothetical protein, partial [Enterobacter chengduensis]|uniref:hypothetical protein n=1 Tax=Enterobacter chengduensis TaxID=2494701 RepID=UPI003D6DC41E
ESDNMLHLWDALNDRYAPPEVVRELARIALASLEAEASGRNPVLAYADSYRDMANQGVESIPVWSVITDLERNIAPLFTAPPAPISVPAAMEMDDEFDSAFEHGKAVGWNAYRAAMLQGAEPVTTDYKLPFDQWLSQQTGTIDVECGCVMTEVFFHWLRVAYEAGKSPVIPDGWVLVPEEPTHEMLEAGDEQFGTYDVYRRMIATAPQQEVK